MYIYISGSQSVVPRLNFLEVNIVGLFPRPVDPPKNLCLSGSLGDSDEGCTRESQGGAATYKTLGRSWSQPSLSRGTTGR